MNKKSKIVMFLVLFIVISVGCMYITFETPVQPTSTIPTITQTNTPQPTNQVPQFVGAIYIPSDTNAGITYTVPQKGTYIFQYSAPSSAFWNGESWATGVLAFRGFVPNWHDSINLNNDAALFRMGNYGYPTKQIAIDAVRGQRSMVSLKAGEVITLIVGDGKPWYEDNTGEIILDVYVLSSLADTPQSLKTPISIPDFLVKDWEAKIFREADHDQKNPISVVFKITKSCPGKDGYCLYLKPRNETDGLEYSIYPLISTTNNQYCFGNGNVSFCFFISNDGGIFYTCEKEGWFGNGNVEQSQGQLGTGNCDPEGFLQHYFDIIEKGNYKRSYNLLSDRFIEKHHPDGYQPYLNWWSTVEKVEILSVVEKNRTDTKVVLLTELSYYYKNGQVDTYDLTEFTIAWETPDESCRMDDEALIRGYK